MALRPVQVYTHCDNKSAIVASTPVQYGFGMKLYD
jgi:L-amino acid N-acyltransferase YncA